jgi:hypothetical protein
MAKLLGGLFYRTVWIGEIGQFVAVVGIAILGDRCDRVGLRRE